MTKERALLKQIQQFLICECEDTYNFASDIEELLAQPEQEPVAWMYDWEHHPESDGYVNIETNLLTSFESIIETPLASNVRPLYTSPPKQEPLSGMKILEGIDTEELPSYKALTFQKGVRWAEQQHGIRGVDDEY
jgi:hypothetical protein